MGENVIAGACLCGAVRFEVSGPLDRVAHCHCTICQRAHGAAFVTWAALPSERVRVTAGDAGLVHYRSSEIGTRSFCRTCGSSMFCTLDTHPGVIDVALASLAPDHGAVPKLHVFWDDRAGWVELATPCRGSAGRAVRSRAEGGDCLGRTAAAAIPRAQASRDQTRSGVR